MRAWRIVDDAGTLQLCEVPDPEPRPGWVVVKVAAAGLCHSDLYLMDGATFTSSTGARLTFEPPLTLGHEIAGTVAAIGTGVSGWRVGDCVVAGQDPSNARFGSPGNSFDGGLAQFVELPVERLLALPGTLTDDMAAVAADSVNTAFYAVARTGALQAGETVGVIGLGGLGINAVRTADLLGAKVYGIDVNEDCFPTARHGGAIQCFTTLNDLRDVRPSLVVDFVGSSKTVSGALDCVELHGRVVVVGLAERTAEIDVYDLILGRKRLLGSHGGDFDSLSEVLAHVEAGRLGSELVHVDFEDVADAYARLRRGEVGARRLVTVP